MVLTPNTNGANHEHTMCGGLITKEIII